MTVRLVGVDVSDDRVARRASRPTMNDGCSAAAALLAERHGRAVRLLIVPATNVFDAVVETVVRLRSSEVYVGESRNALGRRAGAAARRSVGARAEARAARRPARHPPQQRPHRRLSPRRAPADAQRRRSRPDSLASGSTPSRPSARTSIITTSSAPR